MTRFVQKADGRGSLKWIQHLVNDRADEFGVAVAEASGGQISTPISWRSPLRSDHFAEYRDNDFLERVGVDLTRRSLQKFWPRGGPQWDALGVTARGEPILVEAKANIPEVISPRTGASEPSRDLIRKSLAETAAFLGADSTCDWTGTFYQYTNRLAHLYLLHELNEIDTWLLFVYFVGDSDVHGPDTVAEWKAALEVLYGALGLNRRHPLLRRRVDVFVDVRSSTVRATHFE
ncbi:MAG: hypothetical protein WEB90_02930 [Gemmatimonadota bacterium]